MCSTLWTGADRRARSHQRGARSTIAGVACTTGGSSTRARSTRSRSPKARRQPPAVAFGTEARPVDGGFLVTGKKIFASLSGAADITGCCAPSAARTRQCRAATPSTWPCRRGARRLVVGDWDPLGMRGTVSRTLLLENAFVAEDEMLTPRGVYYPRRRGRTCSSRCRRPIWGSRRPPTTSPSPTCAVSFPAFRRSSAACIQPSRSPLPRCASRSRPGQGSRR